MSTDTDTLRKIRALLATAEHPNTPIHEAEAAQALANRLITKYAIDRALLETGARTGEVVCRQIIVEAPHADVKRQLITAAAKANGVRSIIMSTSTATRKVVSLVGFDSSLDALEMTYTSLLVQLANAAKMCGHTSRDWWRGMSAAQVGQHRKSFMLGWIAEVVERLEESARNATADATAEHGTSVAVVLADRRTVVDSKVRELFPNLGRARRQTQHVNAAAFGAGRTSGRSADIGNTRIGSRLAIGAAR